MTNPPTPGNYYCQIQDPRNEGCYGLRWEPLKWDGTRWIGCTGADIVVDWREL